jgi:hypothetical protein
LVFDDSGGGLPGSFFVSGMAVSSAESGPFWQTMPLFILFPAFNVGKPVTDGSVNTQIWFK